MPLHDVSYKHWQGARLGLWHRRWAIARNGLTACLQIRGMKIMVALCWGLGAAAALALFMIGQLLVPDSLAVRWAAKLSSILQTFVGNLTSWMSNHPEISVRITEDVLFYFVCRWLTIISIFLLGIALPCLFTRDLGCNAVVIYSSKAVSRGDYLLGRFAAVFGFLCLTWLGPLCLAWFLGNMLAPNWGFFWHAREALENILISGLTSIMTLSVLALGVSASGVKEKLTSALWFAWWILGAVLAPIALQTKPWLRLFSFGFDVQQIALAAFRVKENLDQATGAIPILQTVLSGVQASTWKALETPDLGGVWIALAAMVGGGLWIIFRRVKPE